MLRLGAEIETRRTIRAHRIYLTFTWARMCGNRTGLGLVSMRRDECLPAARAVESSRSPLCGTHAHCSGKITLSYAALIFFGLRYGGESPRSHGSL
jgi:hypothetical protein